MYARVMIREEIIKASLKYVKLKAKEREVLYGLYTDIQAAFLAGAEFMYEHLINIWHETSEKPQDNSHILIRYNYLGTMEFKSYHINYQCDLTWPELVNFQEIKYWAYIDDIFPKGGEQ